MNINLVKSLVRGQMPRAVEWNSVVDLLKRGARQTNVPDLERLPKTRFFTRDRIPQHSIFPVVKGVPTQDNYRAVYPVEKYQESRSGAYWEGYFATNGRYEIPENTSFYGFILDERHDWIVSISDGDEDTTECGFLQDSFSATKTASGLYVSGRVPYGTNFFFVRRRNYTDTFGVITGVESGGFDNFSEGDGPGADVTPQGLLNAVEVHGVGLEDAGYPWKLPPGAAVRLADGRIADAWVPEIFGTLGASMSVLHAESVTVQLGAGETFHGSATLRAFPAPLIPEGTQLQSGTAVTCRWNHTRGKWFFL